jgi:hypothetical protein
MDKENKTGLSPVLENWIAILDEFISRFLSLNNCINLMIRRESPYLEEFRIFFPLLGSILTQFLAVRRLIMAGLDTAAKQNLRVLVEYIDVSVHLNCNRELISEFRKTEDLEEANRFWHNYIKAGRSRKTYDERSRMSMEEFGTWDWWVEFRKEEERVLGASIHPSLAASQMTLLPEFDSENTGLPGYFGVIKSLSIRTIKYSVFSTIPYLLFGYEPPYDRMDDFDSESPMLQDFGLEAYHGRRILLDLVSYIIRNQNSPELDHDWSQMEKMFQVD